MHIGGSPGSHFGYDVVLFCPCGKERQRHRAQRLQCVRQVITIHLGNPLSRVIRDKAGKMVAAAMPSAPELTVLTWKPARSALGDQSTDVVVHFNDRTHVLVFHQAPGSVGFRRVYGPGGELRSVKVDTFQPKPLRNACAATRLPR